MTDLKTMAARYSAAIARISGLHEQVWHLHPLLKDLCPLAVVEDETFFVFEPAPSTSVGYRPVAASPTPMPMGDRRLRAAFPIEANDSSCCVVTADAFDQGERYVGIFHEFVHCQKWARGEQELRAGLGLARKAQAANDMMWEITYPSPYEDSAFTITYAQWLEALETRSKAGVTAQRARLHAMLSADDWDYLTWQEWKEGLARYLENLMRHRLDLPLNRGGRTPPFSRTSFYAGGAIYIEALVEWGDVDPADLRGLWAIVSQDGDSDRT